MAPLAAGFESLTSPVQSNRSMPLWRQPLQPPARNDKRVLCLAEGNRTEGTLGMRVKGSDSGPLLILTKWTLNSNKMNEGFRGWDCSQFLLMALAGVEQSAFVHLAHKSFSIRLVGKEGRCCAKNRTHGTNLCLFYHHRWKGQRSDSETLPEKAVDSIKYEYERSEWSGKGISLVSK